MYAKFLLAITTFIVACLAAMFQIQYGTFSSAETLCGTLEDSAKWAEKGASHLKYFSETVHDEGIDSYDVKDGSGRTVGYPDGPIRIVSVYNKDNACVIHLERDVKPVEKTKTEKTFWEIEKSFERIKKALGDSEANDYDTASGTGTETPAGPKVVNYFGAVEVGKAKMTARWIRDMDERMKAQRKFVEEVKNGMK